MKKVSVQHCDSGVPITVSQDPVTGGWEAAVDDNASEYGFTAEDIGEAVSECVKIVAHLSRDYYADTNKGARVIRELFHHQAEII
tara:strand:+ start:18379 stop:18633 length:255 start_codon:yes stop_codon:yes gene_type:complete